MHVSATSLPWGRGSRTRTLNLKFIRIECSYINTVHVNCRTSGRCDISSRRLRRVIKITLNPFAGDWGVKGWDTL